MMATPGHFSTKSAQGSLLPISLPTFVISCLFFLLDLLSFSNSPTSVRRYLRVMWISTSPIISDVEHLFIYLLAIYVFFGKMSILIFCTFLNQVIQGFCFAIEMKSCLTILDSNPLLDIRLANIFSYTVACPSFPFFFFFLLVSLAVRKRLL